MIRSLVGRFSLPFFAALLALFLLPTDAQAQYGGFCPDTCLPYDSCDTACVECISEGIDYCLRSRPSTCGEGGGACGGCAITNRWSETQNRKYGPMDNFATYCIGRTYWYGYTNWSQYFRYLTEKITINYETETCNGVSTTREVSRSSEFGECYEFVIDECYYGQYHEWFDIHGRECYF